MTRSSFLASLLASCRAAAAIAVPAVLSTALPASASERRTFENARGWNVERTVGDTRPDSCIMTHRYEDKDDDGAVNAVLFSLEDAQANIVLVYQNWDWKKGESVKAPLFFDKKRIDAKSTWTGDDKLLMSAFPRSVVPGLLAAKTIVLRFDDGNADFAIPDFAAGYEALIRCNAMPALTAAAPQAAPTPVAPAPAPTPPAKADAGPDKAQFVAYAVGFSLRRTIAQCDLATTGKQRTTVDAKVTALQAQVGEAGAGMIRSQLEAKPVVCPTDDADFKRLLTAYVEKDAREFAAFAETFDSAGDKPAQAAK